MAVLEPNKFYSVTAAQTISFVDAGITAQNTKIIYRVAGGLRAYNPLWELNQITGFEQGLGYYIVTGNQEIDLPLLVAGEMVLVESLAQVLAELQFTIDQAAAIRDALGIIPGGGSGGVSAVNGRTGSVTLSKNDVGLPLADNTPDAEKPISAAVLAALNTKLSEETATTLGDVTLTGTTLTLRYTGENGVQQVKNVDLSGLVTNDIHIEGADYDASSNILTLTDNIGATHSVDLSEFSMLVTVAGDGVASITQEGATKLTISRVGQTGQYGHILGKPAVIAEGATQADARAAIGAGTSNVTIGSGANQAMPGNTQIVTPTQLNSALALPTMFLDDSFELKGYLKPDGVTPTTDDDPEAVPVYGLSGVSPEVLPAPIFGTTSKTASTFSQPITNVPAGATVVWTVNDVVETETGAILSKSSLIAETNYEIDAYFTKAGSANSPVSTITITTNPSTGFTVDRRWYVNTRHNFGDDATDPKWNNITIDEGVAGAALTAQLGTGSINMISQVVFDGSENAIGAPGSALYEDAVINSSWNYQQDAGSTIRLSGLDNAKYYQIYVGTFGMNNAGQQSLITAAGEQKSKSNYQTWGTSGEDEFASNFYTVFNNKQATGGMIDIIFNCSGFYQNRLQAFIIEESSTPKP